MTTAFFAFGEILWDCLPSGRYAGGAPFNVAVHLAQLGASVSLISAVGRDSLGDEILQVAKDKNVDVGSINRARIGLATGQVIARLDEEGNAIYEILQPAAWDEIDISDTTLDAVSRAGALVFGSLVARSPSNLRQLNRLLDIAGPLKFFDANLRPPFVDPRVVIDLAKRADVLKLSDSELGSVVSWIRKSDVSRSRLDGPVQIARACATISEATHVPRICITLGERGAALWNEGDFVSASASKVIIKDSVGAGDAFLAALMLGLTRQIETKTVLENACRLAGFVVSQDGATPILPNEIKAMFK